MNKQNRNKCQEQTDNCQIHGGSKSWVKKEKRLKSTDWQLQNRHGDVKYDIGSIVNNTVLTTIILYSIVE